MAFSPPHNDEHNRLDAVIIERMISELPGKAQDLLHLIKQKRRVSFWDKRKFEYRAASALSYVENDRYFIWINPDDQHVTDILIHEIGQLYTNYLGYAVEAKPKFFIGCNPEDNQYMAAFTVNAFRVPITECNLQNYGIDRSAYLEGCGRGFRRIMNSLPPICTPQNEDMVKTFGRAEMGYHYTFTRLLLKDRFSELETIWRDKVRSSVVINDAQRVYHFASKQPLTPKRYVEAQRFFVKVFSLGKYVSI